MTRWFDARTDVDETVFAKDSDAGTAGALAQHRWASAHADFSHDSEVVPGVLALQSTAWLPKLVTVLRNSLPFEAGSLRLPSSLCDLEAIEHGDFRKIQDERKDRRPRENSSHNEERQRTHGDTANREC